MNEEPEDRYPLDEALISMVTEHRGMEMQLRGALLLFLRQHGLDGNWQISSNGKELVRMKPFPVPAGQAGQ